MLFKVVDLPGGHIITYDMSKRPWIILGLSAFLVLQIKAFVALLKPIESPSDSNHAIQEITNP